MDPFGLIYWVAVSLSVVSGLTMGGLIVQRAIVNWHTRRRNFRKDFLTDKLLHHLEDPGKGDPFAEDLRRADRRLLIELFASLRPKLTGEYAQRLVELAQRLGFVEERLEALRSRAWWRRVEACTALAWFQEPRVVAALETALDDKYHAVRVEAARALAQMGAVRSVRQLLDKLALETHERSLAVTDLFRMLAPTATREFVTVLKSDAPEPVKILAAEALGSSGNLDAVEALVRLCRHPSASLRICVLQALGQLGDPRPAGVALSRLDDPVWEVRAQAAITLGQLGHDDAIPKLNEHLNDAQWWVRYEAANSLLRLGESGRATLRSACSSADPRVAEIAQAILNERG